MKNKANRGAVIGFLVAILIILGQPFYPPEGLIPELSSFLVTVPLWTAAIFFGQRVTALMEGGVILFYFTMLGIVVGGAFERRSLWGWLLLLMLVIHHYTAYAQLSRQVGEVVQSVLNCFGLV